MVINGSFKTLDNKNAFEIRNINGTRILSIDRNEHLPNKVFIKNPNNGVVCTGTLVHRHNSDEFILLEEETKILHMKQSGGINLPKFDITSTFGNFTTKPIIRNKEIVLLDNDNIVARLKVNMPDYKIEIDDDCNIYYVMCILFSITMLLPMKTLFKIVSKL